MGRSVRGQSAEVSPQSRPCHWQSREECSWPAGSLAGRQHRQAISRRLRGNRQRRHPACTAWSPARHVPCAPEQRQPSSAARRCRKGQPAVRCQPAAPRPQPADVRYGQITGLRLRLVAASRLLCLPAVQPGDPAPKPLAPAAGRSRPSLPAGPGKATARVCSGPAHRVPRCQPRPRLGARRARAVESSLAGGRSRGDQPVRQPTVPLCLPQVPLRDFDPQFAVRRLAQRSRQAPRDPLPRRPPGTGVGRTAVNKVRVPSRSATSGSWPVRQAAHPKDSAGAGRAMSRIARPSKQRAPTSTVRRVIATSPGSCGIRTGNGPPAKPSRQPAGRPLINRTIQRIGQPRPARQPCRTALTALPASSP